MKTAVLTSGDTIDYDEENNLGIMTDCGLIPWAQVVGFLAVYTDGRVMFIPK